LEKLAETIQSVGFGDRNSNPQTLGERPMVVNAGTKDVPSAERRIDLRKLEDQATALCSPDFIFVFQSIDAAILL
jgi:hypothetical protein